MKTGFERIQEERERQITSEGWTAEGDDKYTSGELVFAARCYERGSPSVWPWHKSWWKPFTTQRNYEKAGALYLAERDRWRRIGSEEVAKLAENHAVRLGIKIDEIEAEIRCGDERAISELLKLPTA